MAGRTRSTNGPTRTRANAPSATAPTTEEFPGLSAPSRVAPDDIASVVMAPETATMPTLMPPTLRDPSSMAEADLAAVTATWRSSQYIDAMWSIDQTRNAFMLVRGLGWRKIYNGRDGAFTALVSLAAQARQTGRQVSFREEADGMVYEIYLW
ncbi:RAD23 family protein [Tenggerimyces flavus]|uniref:Uncharacterized protein n=1 Tax=Tenggerimyces flavus TaxID=1708749 RepID=A0ABV7YBW3_9ACTN|nr:hypothetical protein [Tenggerimyces flavus]MBM7786909.1 hypothetical protein [Tenggerimyces flavus]